MAIARVVRPSRGRRCKDESEGRCDLVGEKAKMTENRERKMSVWRRILKRHVSD